jgi:glutathione S-transferase
MRLGLRSMPFDTAAMYFTEGNIALKVLDDHLAGRDWLVGKGATIADIDVYGVIDYATVGGFDLAQYKNISAWIARLKTIKGFGTPDQILPKESRKA